ncbi:MAG TPA: MarR family transcriptional regulator [Candidatus Saccharimonadales bacterium]|nr:MarR family transcriptional regulator [Candidatus Saccharimonadales bacterium]
MADNHINSNLVEEIFKFSRLLKDRMCFDTELARLSMLQLQALIFLKKHDEAQMGEIAQYFNIELPSATSLINKITKLGLAERKADKNDRRVVLITLTKAGNHLLEQAMQERSKKITKTLSYLSELDKKELLRIMKTLTDTMEKGYEK